MPKIRLYLENKIIQDNEIQMSKNESHYLINVMRKTRGDIIYIFNQNDGEWKAVLKTDKFVKINPLERIKKPPFISFDICLCFSLVKQKKINLIVEKISEIGVNQIQPFTSEYSIKTKINLPRLLKISKESVEQSEGLFLPKIYETKKLQNILDGIDEDRIVVVCDENNKSPIWNEIEKIQLNKITIFVGPVGGWSFKEREIFRKKKNCILVSLGNKLLKSETACIFALSCFTANKFSKLGYQNVD